MLVVRDLDYFEDWHRQWPLKIFNMVDVKSYWELVIEAGHFIFLEEWNDGDILEADGDPIPLK